MYFTHRVDIYDLDLNLICWNSFTSKEKAQDYAKKLNSSFLKHIGKVEVKTYYAHN